MTTRKLLTLLLALALVMSFFSAMPVSASAEQAPANATVTLSQSFTSTNNHPPAANDPGLTVTYTLTPEKGQDGSIDRTSLVLSGDQSGSFNFTFTHGGEYVYVVRPQVQARNYFTYDESAYTVRIFVRNQADGTLYPVVTIWNEDSTEKISGEGEDSDLNYEHIYDLEIIPLTLDDSNDPAGQKVIVGDTPAAASTFNFTFRPVSMNALNITTQPMPSAANGASSLVVSVQGSGSFGIGTLTFTEPGTYVYQLSENNEGVTGYTYDTKIYYITFDVTLDGAVLNATRTITLNGQSVDVAVFTNQYTAPVVPVVGNYTISFAWTNNPVPGVLPAPPASVTVPANSSFTPNTPAITWVANAVAPNGAPIDYYVFQGWNPETVASVNGDMTIYGTWQLVPRNFTITYTDGVDGEEIFPDQVNYNLHYGDTTPAFNGTPTRPGYIFTGWSPAVSATVVDVETYVAQWALVEEAGEPGPEPQPTEPPAGNGGDGQGDVIDDDDVPLAGPGRAWALVNLLSAIATLGIAGAETYSFASKGKTLEDEESKKKLRNKLFTWAPAVGSVVAFILTEDMTAPMTIVDKWTIMMVAILGGNGVLAYLTRVKKEASDKIDASAK